MGLLLSSVLIGVPQAEQAQELLKVLLGVSDKVDSVPTLNRVEPTSGDVLRI
jgi:hypothetical protein